MLRDDQLVWSDRETLRLLHARPLASAETRGDLARWREALHQAPAAAGAEDLEEEWYAVIDRLKLPLRPRKRLVRAIWALLVTPLVDEASRESMRERLARRSG